MVERAGKIKTAWKARAAKREFDRVEAEKRSKLRREEAIVNESKRRAQISINANMGKYGNDDQSITVLKR